jgi:hypothetical protein
VGSEQGHARVTPGGGQDAQHNQSARGAGQFGNDQGGGAAQQHQQDAGGSKGPQHPAASGSHQTLQPHASGHDQIGKSAGRPNTNDDSGNAPHRGG